MNIDKKALFITSLLGVIVSIYLIIFFFAEQKKTHVQKSFMNEGTVTQSNSYSSSSYAITYPTSWHLISYSTIDDSKAISLFPQNIAPTESHLIISEESNKIASQQAATFIDLGLVKSKQTLQSITCDKYSGLVQERFPNAKLLTAYVCILPTKAYFIEEMAPVHSQDQLNSMDTIVQSWHLTAR